MRVLSGQIRDRRGLACAACAMACTARGNALRRITRLGEFLSFLNEVRIGSREQRKRRIEAREIGAYIGGIVRRQRPGDRRHDGVCARARPEVLQLPRKIGCRLPGEPRESAAGVRGAGEGVALRAGWSAGRCALRHDDRAMI